MFFYLHLNKDMEPMSEPMIEIEKMSIDQLAGSFVLIMGAIGSLLLVIWQSRCLCKCRIGCSDNCYIFDCSREPPPIDDEEKKKKEDEKKKKKASAPAEPVADEPEVANNQAEPIIPPVDIESP